MAQFDQKTFNGELFTRYVDTIPKVKTTELIKSRAVIRRDDIKGLFSEQTGSYLITTPLFGRIGGDALNYDGQTNITAETLDTYTQSRIVLGRAKGWAERDFSFDITGGVNFMDEVGKQVAEYWDDINHGILLSILKGIFSMTGKENEEFVKQHTYDISNAKTGSKEFNVTTLNTAVQQALGSNKSKFTLAIMHSQVATNLENLQLLEYLKYTDANGVQRDLSLATLNGKIVIIDDTLVEETGTGADKYNKYTTYVLGDGAFEFTNAGVKEAHELHRDPALNGGVTYLYSRERICYAPYGISFTNQSVATLSPTNPELENGANWELVHNGNATSKKTIDHKAIPIARVITRG